MFLSREEEKGLIVNDPLAFYRITRCYVHDILDDGNKQWRPQLFRHYTNFWPCFWSGPFYRIWPFIQLREVTIEYLQRLRHASGGCLLLRTPDPVFHFWTCLWSNVETNLSLICLVSGLSSFGLPLIHLFYFHKAGTGSTVSREGFDSSFIMPFSWSVVVVTHPI